jgi:two-component system phosphate regulon sensor histidine kinase PhoR
VVHTKRTRVLPVGWVTALLLGGVVAPAVMSIAVGVVALALSKQTIDIVVGVLVLCFACLAVAGGFIAFGLLKRGARLTQMQSDFVANVSHELRTPVAGIRLLAETLTLGRANSPQEAAQMGHLILEQTERLQSLVERILRWRRVEAGALRLEMKTQDVASIVAEAVRPYELKEKSPIELHLDPLLPQVNVDRNAMIDVVHNLVDNAVKFGGDAGPVEVVTLVGGGDVLIEVRDRGPGIPKDDHKRIFERFYRVPLHPRGKQGTGLGLAIAKNIVEAHRGRITVVSEPGIGSTFTVRLPSVEPDDGPMPEHSSAPRSAEDGHEHGNREAAH